MSSWLSFSLPNPFKSLDGELEEEEEELAAPDAPGDEEDGGGGEHGVKEDLSELTRAVGRQLWGVASFLAPSSDHQQQQSPPSPTSPSTPSKAILAGVRNDFAEIGGSVRTGLSMLSNLLHSSLDGDWESGGGGRGGGSADKVGAPGVTLEVVDFVEGLAKCPEEWVEFPVPVDDDFSTSNIQREHIVCVEEMVPSLASLRVNLCPDQMSEEKFWAIYFFMLHPKLQKHDAELLSTPQMVEAMGVRFGNLREDMNASSGINSPCLTVTRDDVQGYQNDTQNEVLERTEVKEYSVVTPKQEDEPVNQKQNVDRHTLERNDEHVTSDEGEKLLNSEQEFSFSDLEDDEYRVGEKGHLMSSQISAPCGNVPTSFIGPEQVQSGSKPAGTSSDGNKLIKPIIKDKKITNDESGDWLTVDDFDLDFEENSI